MPLLFIGDCPHRKTIERAWALVPTRFQNVEVSVREMNEKKWLKEYTDRWWGATGTNSTRTAFDVDLRRSVMRIEHALHEFGHVVWVQVPQARRDTWELFFSLHRDEMPTDYGRTHSREEGFSESFVACVYPKAKGYRLSALVKEAAEAVFAP